MCFVFYLITLACGVNFDPLDDLYLKHFKTKIGGKKQHTVLCLCFILPSICLLPLPHLLLKLGMEELGQQTHNIIPGLPCVCVYYINGIYVLCTLYTYPVCGH